MRRRWVAIALCAGIMLGVLVTRELMAGGEALARGDRALARGQNGDAIWWWRRAARSYLPFAPHVDAAYNRMETLAREAEKNGGTEVALAAWNGVRTSILATRTFWLPEKHRLAPANQRIAELMAARDRSGNPGDRVAWHTARLQAVKSPKLLWTIVALAGAILWIGGATRLALRSKSNSEGSSLRILLQHGAVVGAGLVLWLLGLFLA